MSQYFLGDCNKKVIIPLEFDITPADVVKIFYRKPNNVTGYWIAVKGYDQTSIEYILSQKDLDIVGLWELEVFVGMLGKIQKAKDSLLLVSFAEIPGSEEIVFINKTFICDGQNEFLLDVEVKDKSLSLYSNGILLVEGDDYTLGDDHKTIRTVQIYDAGWKLYAHYAKK